LAGVLLGNAQDLFYVTQLTTTQKIGLWLAAPLLTILIAGIMVVLHLVYGSESLATMQKYRQDCTAYHTRSRGTPRWGNYNPLVFLSMCGILFLFDLPVFALFVISQGMAQKVAAEQDAAVYSRYLDMLDQQIEKEYLEKAILGQCPTEITQLTNPLPQFFKPQYRSNVAAAAVNKPVKIVARAPQPRANFNPAPESVPPELQEDDPAPSKPKDRPAAAKATTTQATAFGFQSSQTQASAVSDAKKIIRAASDAGRSGFATVQPVIYAGAKAASKSVAFIVNILTSKKFLWLAFSVLILLGIILAGLSLVHRIKDYWQSRPVAIVQQQPEQTAPSPLPAASTPQTIPSKPSTVNPVAAPSTVESTHIPSTPPETTVASPLPLPPPAVASPKAAISPRPTTSLETQDQFAVEFKAGKASIRAIAKECDNMIATIKNRIASLPESKQEKYFTRLTNYRDAIENMLMRQMNKLNDLNSNTQSSGARPADATDKLERVLREIELGGDDAKAGLSRMDAEVYNVSLSR